MRETLSVKRVQVRSEPSMFCHGTAAQGPVRMCDVDVSRGAPQVHRWDPIARVRAERPADFDVLLSGSVFFDIVFTDLPAEPPAGTEVCAGGMGSPPGG